MNIILIGFKNCGKTSIGQTVANQTQASFIDTDNRIEQYYNKKEKTALTRREIYLNKGGRYFRYLEKKIITQLDPSLNKNIIATGGGSILDKSNAAHLKKLGTVIYLYASLETLLIRLRSHTIPAFLNTDQPEKHFSDIYNQRELLYKNIADIELSTDNKSIGAISKEIILFMRGMHNG